MDLKGWLERHPLRIIGGVVIATATVVFAPVEYFCSQRIELLNKSSELQARECETQLASIRRGLGDSKYLDIRSFIHERARQAEVQLTPGAKFFPQENFYAKSDDQEWKHEEMTETRFVEIASGARLPTEVAKFGNEAIIHVWRDPSYSPAGGDLPFIKLGPTITIEKTTVDRMLRTVRESINTAEQQEQVTLSMISVDSQHKTRTQRIEAKKKAEELHDRALKGEDFAELARRFSEGTTAERGGEMGVYARGELSKAIEDVVFKMKAGEISDVIETKQGFIILKVLYHSDVPHTSPEDSAEKGPGGDFLAQLDSQFRGDMVGSELMNQLEITHEAVMGSTGSSVEIVNLQKVGNVVYVQLLLSFRDVTVGGLHYSKYYVRREIIMVSDQSNLYVIQTIVPAPDPSPNREIYSRITKWFTRLAIFAE